MIVISKFWDFIKKRPLIAIYILVLNTALLLLERFISVSDIVLGFTSLANVGLLDSIVSFTQMITGPAMLPYTVLFLLLSSLLIAMLMALLFSGAIGSMARAMKLVDEFPASRKMGFLEGYKSRFVNMLCLFFVGILCFEVLLLIWFVAAIPLAIINKAVEFGALNKVILNSTIVATVFIIYCGSLFVRINFMACIPSFYARTKKKVREGLGYAGESFFGIARYFLIFDVVRIFEMSLNSLFQKNIPMFVIDCLFSTVSILFLMFIIFFFYPIDTDEDESDEDEEDEDDEDEEYDDDNEDHENDEKKEKVIDNDKGKSKGGGDEAVEPDADFMDEDEAEDADQVDEGDEEIDEENEDGNDEEYDDEEDDDEDFIK